MTNWVRTSAAVYWNSRLSLVLLDLDNFKKYQDTYSHLAGGKVLGKLVELIG
jgi:diguanylate cyclase (GGDEF)-like protein